MTTYVRNEQPQHQGFPCAACRSNNRFGPLGSNIVVGSLFHNMVKIFDLNLLLPRIVVHERVLLDKCFLKHKTNATRSLAGWAAKFLHVCCAVTAFAKSACSFRRKCFTTCEMPTSCPKKFCATALSFSCIDRWRPSPRWLPRWVRKIPLAAAPATTCRVASQMQGRA